LYALKQFLKESKHMVRIYFYESGCLGFDFLKNGKKKFLLITFFITEERRPNISLVKNPPYIKIYFRNLNPMA